MFDVKLKDLPSALDDLGRVQELARSGVDLALAGDSEGGKDRLQEALVLCAKAQAQLMLNLAHLAVGDSNLSLARSYCEMALDQLEMVNQDGDALAGIAGQILTVLPPDSD